jgi:hypothetical protein
MFSDERFACFINQLQKVDFDERYRLVKGWFDPDYFHAVYVHST